MQMLYWNEYVEHLNYLNDKLLNIAPEIYEFINREIGDSASRK
jgi:hypothetical protein